MTPKWTHDCERCLFLGSVTLNGGTDALSQRYDLYVCEGNVKRLSFIARYDDEPGAYASFPEAALDAIAAGRAPFDHDTAVLAAIMARAAYKRIQK